MKPLVNAEQMSALDRHTIDQLGVPGITLMTRAGEAVAAECLRLVPDPQGKVVLVCGKGNNGGDGFVAARSLLEAGMSAAVILLGPRDDIGGDAGVALRRLEAAAHPGRLQWFERGDGWDFEVVSALFGEAVVLVDALFGTGLSRPILGDGARMIYSMNEASASVVAVDIPSGVCADTGEVMGEAVRATATVTFGFEKRGHHQHPGAARVGKLTRVDIGIPEELVREFDIRCDLLEPAAGPQLLPVREEDSHKGTYGHLGVFAGSAQMPGAAILCLRGALRGGAGLVSWVSEPAVASAAPQRPPEVMLRSPWEGWSGFNALVVGPGWGRLGRESELVALLKEVEVPLCIDADGLGVLGGHLELLKEVRAPVVLTPHPKELGRLVGRTVSEVQRDRIELAKAFAIEHECVVVLKGARTVVASFSGAVSVIAAGNPGMATAGTGDVLAGVIGAMLAQGFGVFDAARLGALLHGCAGDIAASRFGQVGMSATDLVNSMGDVLSGWDR